MSPETDPVRRLFANPPILETERLVLRQLELADADAVYEYASLAEVTNI